MDNKIAIVGYSCILPGANNEYECWDMVSNAIDNLKELPDDRLDVTAYYNNDQTVTDKIYCTRGGFIDNFDFNPREYGLNLLQMEDCDTNQTLSLLKVKEALESANIDPFKGRKNIGCVLGIGGGQKLSHEMYSRLNYTVVEKVAKKMGMNEKDTEVFVEKYKSNFPVWRLDSFPGFLGNVTSGRCCNVFDLDGMNCVVDSACASSLTAVKVAIDELLYGNCRTMIAGATCTDNSIGMYMAFSKTPVFSRKKSLTAYDHNTSGMLIGEGSAMVIIKRLEHAIEDGDKIHAVMLACGASSDGKSSGIYTPTFIGQESVVQRALAKANIDPKTITMVEGHGTGTNKGDANELSVLQSVFKDCDTEQIAVGSIKSNIGHLKAVAGLASLIKIIMCLKHKTIAPSINVEFPPPHLELNKSALYINTKLRPWFTKNDIPRRAGISSFGFGGTNFHLVLEEYEKEHLEKYRMNNVHSIIIISAKNCESIIEICKEEEKLLLDNELNYHILCKKNNIRNIFDNHPRVGFVVNNHTSYLKNIKTIIDKLNKNKSDNWNTPNGIYFRNNGIDYKNKVVSLFTGQGSQYTYMFNEVALNWPQFRNSINKMNSYSIKNCDVCTSDILYPRKPYDNEDPIDENIIKQTVNSSLCTSASSIGCYQIFKDAGFKSDYMAGHSLGEFAALYASDCINEEEYYSLMSQRAFIMNKVYNKKGVMAAIIADNISEDDISKNIQIANYNSKKQIVISGYEEDLDVEIERLEKRTDKKFKCIKLKVGNAYHSEIMKPNQDEFNKLLDKVEFKKTDVKVYSNLTGNKYKTENKNEIQQCVTSHMTKSVKFVQEIQEIYKDGGRIFVEFGPTDVLNKFVNDILKDKNDIYTISINPSKTKDSDLQLREAAMQLCLLGYNLDNFDPWQTENPFHEIKPRPKSLLNLSAATYVSKKTKKQQEEIMNDGYKIQYGINKESNSQNDYNILLEKYNNLNTKCNDLNVKLEQERDKKIVNNTSNEVENLKNIIKEKDEQINNIEQKLNNHREFEIRRKALYEEIIKNSYNDSISNTKYIPKNENISKSDDICTSKNNNAMTVVMDVIAEKTGYEVDMIEHDMDLETDLGIDSIKRVEILGSVQTLLNITVTNLEGLSQTQTVQDVIDFMNNEVGGEPTSTQSQGTVSNTTQESSNQGAPPTASTQNVSGNAMAVVMDVIAEKTGYEVDMIEHDMDLETDLGIDSIKRVEILGSVQTQLNITVTNLEGLSQTQTVQDVIDFMNNEVGGESTSTQSQGTASNTTQESSNQCALPTANTQSVSGNAMKVVMDVIAEKTGYEVDMIEHDMDLETDLGIDSIKRVEILGSVQTQLNITVTNLEGLSQTQTVQDVIDFMNNEVGGEYTSTQSQETASNTTQESSNHGAPPTASTQNVSGNAMAVVMDVIAEKTGYEVDMIEHDMDLETDLGIDSIKRVEILGSVQTQLNITVSNLEGLSQTQTVQDVIDFMNNEVGGEQTITQSQGTVTNTTQESSNHSAPPTASTQNVSGNAMAVVMDVIAEKTGYEVDMIEHDMDLETDLGIDSIKRVEILGSVQTQLDITVTNLEGLSQTQTVQDVIDFMNNEVGGEQTSTQSQETASNTTQESSNQVPPPTDAPQNVSGNAMAVVMDVIAEKTGYEVDMIEHDMDLETDLGIDSIKRVEILGSVQTQLDITVTNLEGLSQTQTVQDVIDFMNNEVGGEQTSTQSQETASNTTQESSNQVPPPTDAPQNVSGNAMAVVMDVIAEKTGYEVDMIEHDMDLETDLGIDSIKRVEILGSVQTQLDITVTNLEGLSQTQTVQDVIDFMNNEVGGEQTSTQSQETASNTTQESSNQVPPPTDAPQNVSGNAMAVVMDVIAEKTGYEVDMIEHDMDLETDLGIDSIKRVEILGSVQTQLNITVTNLEGLSQTQTVQDVIDFMNNEVGGEQTSTQSQETASNTTQESSNQFPPPTDAPQNVSGNAMAVVMDVIAEKTGYEVDMIEHDMDLETDLGIDSIKRVEILGSVQTQLNITVTNLEGLSQTQTVQDVIDFMNNEVGGNTGYENVNNEKGKKQIKNDVVTLSLAQLQEIPLPEHTNINASSNRCVILVDDNTEYTSKLKQKLVEYKWNVVVLKLPNINKNNHQKEHNVLDYSEESIIKIISEIVNTYGKPEGFIYLDSIDNKNINLIEWLFLMAKHLKKYLNETDNSNRRFFMCVTNLDGQMGMGDKTYTNDIEDLFEKSQKGAINGLVKTLKLEWDTVHCRTIDIDNYSKDHGCEYFMNELYCSNMKLREIGYKNGHRYTIIPKNFKELEESNISKNDVFIVSGGGKGITPHCVREIAKQINGGTFILLGRSELIEEPEWAENLTGSELSKAAMSYLKNIGDKITPKIHKNLLNKIESNRDVEKSIESIKVYNANVLYYACDVNSMPSIEKVIKKIEKDDCLRISGVIHASGVLRDKKIENKKLEDLHAVYGTKINGLKNILSCIKQDKLNHLVLYSSLAGFYGNIGQSDYSMANEVLNKFAHQYKLHYPQCNVKSLCFGPWDSGMVTSELKKHFIDNGVEIIPLKEGSEIVSDLILHNQNTQMLVGNWIDTVNNTMPSEVEIDHKILSTNKFLENHIIKNNKVLPFTMILSYLANLVMSSYPGYVLDSISKLTLFKGIVLDTDVNIQIIQKKTHSLSIDIKLNIINNTKKIPSSKMTVNLAKKDSKMTYDKMDLTKDDNKYNADIVYEKILFHTGIFRIIKDVINVSEKKITLLCHNKGLTEDEMGQFPIESFNGFAYDVTYQIMLIWVYIFKSSASLPEGAEYIKCYKNIPKNKNFYVSLTPNLEKTNDNHFEGECCIHDDSGEVYYNDYKSVIINKELSYN